MALKDLSSDLSAFKGQTNPKSIDNQIKRGVDFFPNDEATGFTPKTDLESLYHKANSQYSAKEFIPASDGQYNQTWSEDFPQYTSPFMTTPIADYVSRYPTDPSVTWGSEDGTMTGMFGIHIQPQFKSPFMVTPLADYVSQYPRNASVTWNLGFNDDMGNMTGPSNGRNNTTVSISHMKRRGGYYHYITPNFQNQSIPNTWDESWFGTNYFRYFNENNGRSIHISPGGQLVAGYYYGAIQDGNFIKFNPGNALTDSQSPIGGYVTQFASLTSLSSRNSQFSKPETVGGDNIYTLPVGWQDGTLQTTLNIPEVKHTGRNGGWNANIRNTGPFTFNSTDYKSGILQQQSNLDKIDALTEFKLGTFINVPAGLDENMKMSTKSYREISDPFNIAAFRQPFILRGIPRGRDGTEDGNWTYPGRGRWGVDALPLGAGDWFTSMTGGFVRGAPTLSGLIDRNVNDKTRIIKFLGTPQGVGFLAKQFALQLLNPTIETKLYNPFSILNLPGAGQFQDVLDRGLSVLGVVALMTSGLPIYHSQRHRRLGKTFKIGKFELETGIGDRYEGRIKDAGGGDGRLAYQSKALAGKPFKKITPPTINLGGSAIGSWIANQANTALSSLINKLNGMGAGATLVKFNPNRYWAFASSAPLTIDDGLPSFVGTPLQAGYDAENVINKPGSTFNPHSIRGAGTAGSPVYDYSTLISAAKDVKSEYRYESKFSTEDKKKVDSIGNATDKNDVASKPDTGIGLILNGNVKTNSNDNPKTSYTDKVNLTPYALDTNDDFIKFKFYDMVNQKWIIFRAILEGISDSISPEYGEERYVGRPDKVYVYQGADRNVSFTFSIYPKTKQELPVLMEKLNYLVGLCYPSYTESERMITPFMRLTLGDMFDNAPGLLSSLNITVEENTTWELDEGLQFPHYIKAACEFKYIGNNVLASKGKHYGLNWIPDGNKSSGDDTAVNRFTNESDLGFPKYPNRKDGGSKDMTPLFDKLYPAKDNENQNQVA